LKPRESAKTKNYVSLSSLRGSRIGPEGAKDIATALEEIMTLKYLM